MLTHMAHVEAPVLEVGGQAIAMQQTTFSKAPAAAEFLVAAVVPLAVATPLLTAAMLVDQAGTAIRHIERQKAEMVLLSSSTHDCTNLSNSCNR
jgi:hypothetical protein